MKVIKDTDKKISDLKQLFAESLPEYRILKRTKRYFVVMKSPSVGCNVVVKRNRIVVSETFPTRWAQLLFIFTIFILGVIIPLALYYIFFYKRLMKFEKEVHEFISENI